MQSVRHASDSGLCEDDEEHCRSIVVAKAVISVEGLAILIEIELKLIEDQVPNPAKSLEMPMDRSTEPLFIIAATFPNVRAVASPIPLTIFSTFNKTSEFILDGC